MSKFYHYIFIFTVLNLIPINTRATTIVFIRLDSVIYIGADSQSSTIIGEFRNINACKIYKIYDVYFAFSGINRWAREFSTTQIAVDCFSKDSTIDKRCKLFDDCFSIKFKAFVNSIIDTTTDLWKYTITKMSKQWALIIKPSNPIPITRLISFWVEGTNETGHIVWSKSYPPLPKKTFLSFGVNNTIAKRFNVDTNITCWKKDPIRAINYCIKLEADSTNFVSLPIDILKISEDRTEWIQRKNNCYNCDQF